MTTAIRTPVQLSKQGANAWLVDQVAHLSSLSPQHDGGLNHFGMAMDRKTWKALNGKVKKPEFPPVQEALSPTATRVQIALWKEQAAQITIDKQSGALAMSYFLSSVPKTVIAALTDDTTQLMNLTLRDAFKYVFKHYFTLNERDVVDIKAMLQAPFTSVDNFDAGSSYNM